MITQKRREEILNFLSEKGSASVTELTEKLDCSESTIRRDLIALAKMGKLNKVHGGALLSDTEFIKQEDSIDTKLSKNTESKRRIAEYAASQIRDNDFIYLDAGSSTLMMVDYITAKNITVITNGIAHAKELVKKGIKVIILGGELKSSTEAIVGLTAAKNIHYYNFSKAFLGTNGITLKQGFSTPDPDEAFLKAAAIDRAFVSYILADSSKFGKVSTVSFAQLESSAIITDKLNDKEFNDKTVVKEVM